MNVLKDTYSIKLPGGIIINDNFNKTVNLTILNGHIEELIGRISNSVSLAFIVTQLLSNCVTKIGSCKNISTNLIGQMQVSDRNYLMLKLREITFGEKVNAVFRCPNETCKKKIDVDFLLSDIPVKYSSNKSLYHKCIIKSPVNSIDNTMEFIIEYRFPNGNDQELLLKKLLKKHEKLNLDLLKRCIRSINGNHKNLGKVLDEMPEAILLELDKTMKKKSSGIDTQIEAMCPECYNKFNFQFNIAQFFIDELALNLSDFYRQIHRIAFYYKWSEQDILSLNRNKRIKYAEMISEQVETALTIT